MDANTLETLLKAPGLELAHDGHTYTTDDEDGLVVLANARGGDIVRFNKVNKIILDPDLTSSQLVALEREDRYTVLELSSIFAIERHVSRTKERRRTGFF